MAEPTRREIEYHLNDIKNHLLGMSTTSSKPMLHVARAGAVSTRTGEAPFDVAGEVSRLLNDARMSRGIVPTPDFEDYLFLQVRDVYTPEHARRARLWIIFGDWQFRGRQPDLTVADFFPTDKQVSEAFAATRAGSLFLADADAIRRRVDQAFRDGIEHERRRNIEAERKRDRADGTDQIVRELVTAKLEVTELRLTNSQLHRRIAELAERLERRNSGKSTDGNNNDDSIDGSGAKH